MSQPLEDLTGSIEFVEFDCIKLGEHSVTADGIKWIANKNLLSALSLSHADLKKIPPECKSSRCVRYQKSNGQFHLWKYWTVLTLNQQGLDYLIAEKQSVLWFLKLLNTDVIALKLLDCTLSAYPVSTAIPDVNL
jgi:hypothetical protein